MVVSLIPAFFSIGRGITGLAVNDATAVAQPVAKASHFWSGALLIYFIATIILLSIVASYLIALHNANQKLRPVPKKQSVKHMAKMKSHIQAHFKKITSIRLADHLHFKNIDDDQAGRYIVMVVAIVGLIAILIMVAR
jgi:hypothetical protein